MQQLQDTVRIEAKDYVNIEYKGYLDQPGQQMAFVKSVNASSIYLAASMKTLPPDGYEIRASDITGFRRMPCHPAVHQTGNKSRCITGNVFRPCRQ
jgi:hypothetical protein